MRFIGNIDSKYTKEELLYIVDSTANFEAWLASFGFNMEEGEGVDGLVLDLVGCVSMVDGEELTDGECLYIVGSIYDLYRGFLSGLKDTLLIHP